MTNIEIWLLAISLAMDCFSVSIASGFFLHRTDWPLFFKMALLFGVFQGLMPLLGWMGACQFYLYMESIDHWIAFGLLGFIGSRMIFESFSPTEAHTFDPRKMKVLLMLSVATSIDALAIGISLPFTGMSTLVSILPAIFIITFVTFILSMAGCFIGVYCGRKFPFKIEFLGGIILIAIGCKILIEHLNLLNI